jgi:hypothetical protein
MDKAFRMSIRPAFSEEFYGVVSKTATSYKMKMKYG